jgi:tight adherence protein C
MVQVVLVVAALLAGGCLVLLGVLRWRRRRHMRRRVQTLAIDWSEDAARELPKISPTLGIRARLLADRLGSRLGERWPGEVGLLAQRVDRAGLTGVVPTAELLGWKVVCAAFGIAAGIWALLRYGPGFGLAVLALGVLIGWFGIDAMLVRYHAQRRRAIVRDLPTIMDLLVLSLEAGMGLDRALRTLVHEYRSVLADEIRRVLHEIDLGLARGEAFERMAARVGLEDLHSLSRAIVQSEELGVSLVGVMQAQSHEVRLSRRRAAEAEALQAPIKMLVPLVVFILPTLFMLLLGPVGLRAAAAIAGLGR